jgi:hypothetical protein
MIDDLSLGMRRLLVGMIVLFIIYAAYDVFFTTSLQANLAYDINAVSHSRESSGPGNRSHILILIATNGDVNIAYPILSDSKATIAMLDGANLADSPIARYLTVDYGDLAGTVLGDHSIGVVGRTKSFVVPATDLPLQVMDLPAGTPVVIWPHNLSF